MTQYAEVLLSRAKKEGITTTLKGGWYARLKEDLEYLIAGFHDQNDNELKNIEARYGLHDKPITEL